MRIARVIWPPMSLKVNCEKLGLKANLIRFKIPNVQYIGDFFFILPKIKTMKNIVGAFIILLVFASCNDKKELGNLQITGNIKGLKDGTLYIQKLQDTSLVVLDSIVINGKSSFETDLNIESPEMLYL